MRYKVKMSESIEFVIEGTSEEEVLEWLRCNNIKEVRILSDNFTTKFNEKIISKTVMPADVTIDDYVEDVIER